MILPHLIHCLLHGSEASPPIMKSSLKSAAMKGTATLEDSLDNPSVSTRHKWGEGRVWKWWNTNWDKHRTQTSEGRGRWLNSSWTCTIKARKHSWWLRHSHTHTILFVREHICVYACLHARFISVCVFVSHYESLLSHQLHYRPEGSHETAN